MNPEFEEIRSPREKAISSRRAALETRVMKMVGASVERASWARCRRLGSRLGLLFFAAGRKRRELAISNIQMALGLSREEAMRVARRSSQNWGMTTCEFLRLPAATPQQIRDYSTVEGLEHLHAAHALGRGVIVLMAHLGNWEITAARLAQEFPTSAIVRPLSNAAAQNHMSNIRRGTGYKLISKYGAGRPAAKSLRSGELLILLPDRHAGDEGILLPLFGRETRFESSPARLALLNNSPIVPVMGVRREPWNENGRIDIRIFPAFEVTAASREDRENAVIEGTRQVIASLETMIRAHPDQWSWMLRRWRKSDIGESDLRDDTAT